MGNPFSDFVKYRPKCSTFFISKYIVLYEKNAFAFDFGPCEVPQPENIDFQFYAFPVGTPPEVQNWI